ncbi:kinase-like domain-containing protein, partial [Scleroderma yunnanense]
MVRAFEGFSDEVREACYECIRTAHVFPAFTTFVYLHLSLCAPADNRLWQFKTKMRQYQLRGEGWCIHHYAEIRDYLYSLYQQVPVDRHICNRNLVRNNQLHILDVQHLGAQVALYLVNADRAQSFYATVEKDNDIAQSMVDLLQALLDLHPRQFDVWYRPCFLGAIIRLTRKTLVYPTCLEIRGVGNYAKTGAGGCGVIYQGTLLGRTVALKRLINKGQDYDRLTKDFAHEAVLWRNVNHANCLPFYGIFKDLQLNNGDLYLVSPWMEQGDLSAYLSENPNVDRLPLVYDIANGLEYLHKMQPTIVHGDLKCLNIFVTNNSRACIADFGLSNARDFSTKANSSISIGGTPGYIAPEIYHSAARGGDELRNLDFRRCDMFAFGSVIYEIYVGEKSKLHEYNVCGGDRPPRPSQELCKMRKLDDDIWLLIE